MELGQSHEDSSPISTLGEDKDKVVHPSFTLKGAKMDEFLEECPDAKKVGYKLDGKASLEVSGYRDDEYGKELTLKVKSLEPSESDDEDGDGEGKDGLPEGSPAEEAAETPAEEADEEEKMLGYKRPQKKSEPAPGASAKELSE